MSHFDELSTLYEKWHKEWFEDYMRHRHIIFRIATKFAEFIGAPSTFDGKENRESPKKSGTFRVLKLFVNQTTNSPQLPKIHRT